MSASELPEELLNIPLLSTLGASFIGLFLSSVFFGVTLLQAYQYFDRYWKEDPLALRLYVCTFFAIPISVPQLCCPKPIENYGNPAALITVTENLVAYLVISSFVGVLVQFFYAYRLYILSGRKIWIPATIIVLALACLATGWAYIVELYVAGSMLDIPSVTYLSTTSLGLAFVCDLLIMFSMIAYLLQGRQPEIRRTHNLIKKLIAYSIYTGVITTTATMISLLLGQLLKESFYNTIFYFPLNVCYLNSMLALLNARQSLRDTQEAISFRTITTVSQPASIIDQDKRILPNGRMQQASTERFETKTDAVARRSLP